jgi:hypothetical protein
LVSNLSWNREGERERREERERKCGKHGGFQSKREGNIAREELQRERDREREKEMGKEREIEKEIGKKREREINRNIEN